MGDYIDRGPKIKETLEIVKQMVENGSAIALLGNHEYNALCYHTKNPDGSYLREHSIKNNNQHSETLRQFQDHPKEFQGYLEWFKTLPLFHETDKFRAVHACWDKKKIEFLKKTLKDNHLKNDLLNESVKKNTDLHDAIDQTLKGKEIKMPDGESFTDKDGAQRSEIRIKWWEAPDEVTYKEISIEPLPNLPDTLINKELIKDNDFYNENEKPVFFGHYWLKGNPSLYRGNICCLDYSVAKCGVLAAYSFDNEPKLSNEKFTYEKKVVHPVTTLIFT
ncbi:MAG: metallophosphoesterase [Ginsengibacter sp.]